MWKPGKGQCNKGVTKFTKAKDANGKGTKTKGGKKGTYQRGNRGQSAKGQGKKCGGKIVVGKTPDWRNMCCTWNDGEDCDGSCGMVHACRVQNCFQADRRMIEHEGIQPQYMSR